MFSTSAEHADRGLARSRPVAAATTLTINQLVDATTTTKLLSASNAAAIDAGITKAAVIARQDAYGEGLAINSAYREYHNSPHHEHRTLKTVL